MTCGENRIIACKLQVSRHQPLDHVLLHMQTALWDWWLSGG